MNSKISQKHLDETKQKHREARELSQEISQFLIGQRAELVVACLAMVYLLIDAGVANPQINMKRLWAIGYGEVLGEVLGEEEDDLEITRH